MAIQVMYIYIMIYMHDTHFISCYDEVFLGLFVCLFFFYYYYYFSLNLYECSKHSKINYWKKINRVRDTYQLAFFNVYNFSSEHGGGH